MVKIIDKGFLPPDDPIFSEGITTFFVARRKRKRDVEFQADLDGWLGDEFKNGLEAQERGEDPMPKRDE